MLRSSRKVVLKMYDVPETPTFKISMASEREILGIVTDPSTGTRKFLVQEPESGSTEDFSFEMIELGQVFDKPNRWEYLGETYVVVDPTSDRPWASTWYVYGERVGQSTGGAL